MTSNRVDGSTRATDLLPACINNHSRRQSLMERGTKFESMLSEKDLNDWVSQDGSSSSFLISSLITATPFHHTIFLRNSLCRFSSLPCLSFLISWGHFFPFSLLILDFLPFSPCTHCFCCYSSLLQLEITSSFPAILFYHWLPLIMHIYAVLESKSDVLKKEYKCLLNFFSVFSTQNYVKLITYL